MPCRIYIEDKLSFFDGDNAQARNIVDIDSEQAKYLRQVMRMQAGESITVFDGEGGEYLAQLTYLAKDGAECQLIEFIDVNREISCQTHIIQAANKSEKIETVLQKGTELGATSFQIINSERATLNLPQGKREKRLARWQKIIVEAAEQSERTAMPSVTWVDKLANVKKYGLCLALHPRDAMLWQDIRDTVATADAITLAIGPEGGWTNKELLQLETMGFQALLFGARVMRTETAAPALLAAIHAVAAHK